MSVLVNFETFNKVMKNIHENSVRCDKCDKQFISPKGLPINKRDHHVEII
jgi:formylmethanofuran dehydrogenase subunit E